MTRFIRVDFALACICALPSVVVGCGERVNDNTSPAVSLVESPEDTTRNPPLEHANSLIRQGKFQDAVNALSPRESWLANNSVSVADKCEALHLLSAALQGSSSWAESTDVLLTIATLPFGDDLVKETEIAKMHASLGEAYRAIKDYEKAVESFRTSVQQFEQLGMTTTEHYFTAKNGEAVLLMDQGDYEAGETLLNQVITGLTDLGNSRTENGTLLLSKCLGNLGLICKNEGSLVEAAELYEQSIELRAGILGEDHPNLIIPYYNLGMLHAENREYENAKVFVDKAVKIGESVWPEDQPDLLHMKRNLVTIEKYIQ